MESKFHLRAKPGQHRLPEGNTAAGQRAAGKIPSQGTDLTHTGAGSSPPSAFCYRVRITAQDATIDVFRCFSKYSHLDTLNLKTTSIE